MWIKILADFLTIQTRNNKIIGYKFRVAVFNIANTKICSKCSKIEKLEFNCPFSDHKLIGIFSQKEKRNNFEELHISLNSCLKLKISNLIYAFIKTLITYVFIAQNLVFLR